MTNNFNDTNKYLIWEKYNKLLDDLKNYNRADTANMSENEMNKFRHIAGSAALSKEYNPNLVRFMGYGKEFKDLFQGRGLKDTKQDLKNNEIGINIGKEYPYVNNKSIYDYVLKYYIKPDAERNFIK